MRLITNNEGNDDNRLQKAQMNNILQMMNSNQKIDPKFLNSMMRLIDKYKNLLDSFQKYLEENDPNKNNDENKNDISINKKRLRKRFNAEEDLMLRNIVFTHGPKNWRFVASMMPNKTPRQCRDRYMNYLAPGFIHSDWTKKEDTLLANKYLEYGPQWSKIQQFFPLRTSNSIRNRFKYFIIKNDKRNKDVFNPSNNQSNSKMTQNENFNTSIDHNNQKDQKEKNEQIEIPISDSEYDFTDQNSSNFFINDFEINENDFHFLL